MKRLLIVVGLALAIFGCGGGGALRGPGGSPADTTRDAVRESSARAFFGAAQSGALAPMGGMSGTTGSNTGGGFGIFGIGGFVHQFAPGPGGGAGGPRSAMRLYRQRMQSAQRGTVGTTGSGTDGSVTDGTATDGTTNDGGGTGGTGGGGWDGFYFDDYLGLWVDTTSTDTSFSQKLYIDEAKTEPAGSFETTFPTGWDAYPYEYRSSFEITAGDFAGAHGLYVTSISSEMEGTSSYENVWPGFGSDKGWWKWRDGASSWSYEGHSDDGAWYKGSGEFFDDWHGTSTFEDSFGYRFSYVYNSDGSGSAKIEGPDKGLPATMTWTAEGHVRIVWADGTVDEWDWWGVGVEGGTTGTGTNGGGGTPLARPRR